jgi:septal ring factor EnvC (AmiA/AmiB activator)
LEDDTTLLRLYSSVPDLERAKTRQLNQIQSLIETTHTNIADLQVQREELQRRAANQQRAGRVVDDVILRELVEVDAETARLERLIAAKQLEMQEVEASFTVSRARLEVLLGT